MAIIKISELPAADSPVSPSDVVPLLQNGVTKKASIDQFGFLPAGSGAVVTTVQAKLRETVSVRDFGAVGDGVTDDAAAIQAALNTGKSVFIPDGVFFFGSPISFTADGQSLFGNGNNSVLKHRGTLSAGPSWISVNAKNDVTVSNLQIDGGTGATAANPGIWIEGGSKNFTVDGCLFKGGNQVVYLSTCSNVKVVNNTFDETYYGVIQRFNFASSHVLVDGNTCINSYRDFVEANCAAAAPSENWIVSNNTFDTSSTFPTPGTETRFVGITSVRGVVITGNTVLKAAGDAAVHLEDTLGDTIVSNNVFDNCLTSGGNSGYIFLLNTAEHAVISDNIFLRTDATLPAAYAIDTSSNSFAFAMTITGNIVRGQAAGGNMNGFFLGFQNTSSATTCVGNVLQDLDAGVKLGNTFNCAIGDNVFNRCASPIEVVSGASFLDSIVSNNNFVGTTGTNDITSGATTRVSVQGNRFVKAVALGTCTDVFVNDNTFGSAASLVTPSGTRAYSPVNVFQSPAVMQARYPSGIGSDWQVSASKRAVNVLGSAVATFRIVCSATVSTWSPGTIRIEAAACDGNGSVFTAAWWAYKFQVLGSNTNTNEAVEDSGGTTASYAITFTNVSASATEVVFDVSITATNADTVVVNLSTSYYFGVTRIE